MLGEARTQLALSLAALLPWLCLHFRHSRHAPLAAVCIAVRPCLVILQRTLSMLPLLLPCFLVLFLVVLPVIAVHNRSFERCCMRAALHCAHAK